MEFTHDEGYRIESVSSLLSIKEHLLYAHPRWLFRGHSDSKYELLPGLGRLFKNDPAQDLVKLKKMEMDSFAEFKLSSYSILREHNAYYLLAVAQHHGLITRLLDWSASALAALFFAVEKESSFDKDGALFAYMPPRKFNFYANKQANPFEIENDDFISVPFLSDRIKAQQGYFQVFGEPTIPFPEVADLYKFRVVASCKEKIKEELALLGISYSVLFPDLGGLCETLNYHHLHYRKRVF